jgi:hypothetical protein
LAAEKERERYDISLAAEKERGYDISLAIY